MKTISRTNIFSAKAPEMTYPNTSSNSSLETSTAACVSEPVSYTHLTLPTKA